MAGAYYVTICTYKKECLLGDVMDGEMKLNMNGQYAHHQWLQIPNRFTNVELDEFVIMPNHIHGIILIRFGRDEGVENNR